MIETARNVFLFAFAASCVVCVACFYFTAACVAWWAAVRLRTGENSARITKYGQSVFLFGGGCLVFGVLFVFPAVLIEMFGLCPPL